MDFSWDALESAHDRLIRLRQRMADWSAAAQNELSPEAREFDREFRDAVADDLDLPEALSVLGRAVTARFPEADKYALLAGWDVVLGLDLERAAREGFDVPAEVRDLIEERDRARAGKDFDRSDAIRSRLIQMGWEVMDTADGTKVRPLLTR
jgi:cysteinyl-tRNA synthetase